MSIGGILGLVLVLIVTVWFQVERAHEELRSQTLTLAETRGVQLAQAMGGQVGGLLASVDLALQQLRLQWTGESDAYDAVVRGVLATLSQRVVNHVSVVDAAGNIVYNSVDPTFTANVATLEHVAVHADGQDRLFISKPLRSRVAGEWAFVINRPLLKDGRFAGTVNIALTNGQVAESLAQLSLGDNDVIALMRTDGHFLARTLANDAAMGRSVPPNRPFLQPASGTHGVFYEAGVLDGKTRLYTWHRIEPYGLVVALGADKEQLLAQAMTVYRNNQINAASLLLVTVVAAGAVIMLLIRVSRSEQALEASVAFRKQVFDQSPVPMVVLDPVKGRFLDANQAAARAYGVPDVDAVIGLSPVDVSAPVQADGTPTEQIARQRLQDVRQGHISMFEWRHQRPDGTQWDGQVLLSDFAWDNQSLLLFCINDITERKIAEERVRSLVNHDDLTQLFNRRGLQENLKAVHALAQRRGGVYALLFIDLDHFKFLNDSMGHEAGDMALIEVARRLREHTRASDVVARLAGDEFVVLVSGDAEDRLAEEAGQMAAKLIGVMREPILVDGTGFSLTCSIGIALGNPAVQDGADLLRWADLAMYSVKESGRNAFRFFDGQIHSRMLVRIGLEQDLRLAVMQETVRRESLMLHGQPIVDDQAHVLGYEALLRWNRHGSGMVPPAEFIPVAEHSGLIVAIGDWVLTQACTLLANWAKDPLWSDRFIAVNLSAVQIKQPQFLESVQQILRQTGANPQHLKLEMTESLLHEDLDDTVVKLQALRDMGVKLSLDDFGTGYSSLSYLRKLPIHELKIDRSFVLNALEQEDDAAVARMIVQLAQTLHMDVVAEGVETREQFEFLTSIGCRKFQGYMFGRPEPMKGLCPPVRA